MSKIFFTTLFTIILGFSCNTTLAQEVPVTEETYRLCSKFPHNSKCEGIEAPVSLEEREGGKTSCQIRWSDIQKLQACKFIVQDNTIKVYLETGKKLNLLDNQKATKEIIISEESIMFFPVSNKYQWKKELFKQPKLISNIDVFFRVDSETIPNRSNRISIYFPYKEIKDDDLKTQKGLLISLLNKQRHLNHNQASIDNQLTYLQSQETSSSASKDLERLLSTNECIRCDLSGADLTKADLNGANLEGANLIGAYLLGAKLDGVNLDGALLFGAELPFSSLKGSSLIGANLTSINLQKANLTNSDLSESQLLFSNLSQANLSLTNFTKASLEGVELKGANLEEANLTEAVISVGTRITEVRAQSVKRLFIFGLPSNLVEANFLNADLSHTKLNGSIFSKANLTNAKLIEADFSPFKGKGKLFYVSNLNHANLNNANLTNANLNKASLESANLANATLGNTRMTKTNMNNTNLSGVQLENADLKGSTFCNATIPEDSVIDNKESCEN